MKKMIKKLSFVVFAGVLSFSFVPSEVQEELTVKQDNAPVVLKFEKSHHDFGSVKKGPIVKEVFKFKNIGKTPVQITSHTVQCGCTIPEYSKDPVLPGKTSEVTVGFNTGVKPAGSYDKNVTLNTTHGTYVLTFHVDVVE